MILSNKIFKYITSYFISSIIFFIASSSSTYIITSPLPGETWRPGDTVSVKWAIWGQIQPSIDVNLVYGTLDSLQKYQTLCADMDPSIKEECNFVVDNDVPLRQDYKIEIVARDEDEKNVTDEDKKTISQDFTILGVDAGDSSNKQLGSTPTTSSTLPQNIVPAETETTIGTDGESTVVTLNYLPTPVITPLVDPAQEQITSPKCGQMICTADIPCCSQWDICGATKNYCGIGCQAGKSFAGKCLELKGLDNNELENKTPHVNDEENKSKSQEKCGEEMCNSEMPCCSKWNYCGASKNYCGIGCQMNRSFAGKCWEIGMTQADAGNRMKSSTKSGKINQGSKMDSKPQKTTNKTIVSASIPTGVLQKGTTYNKLDFDNPEQNFPLILQ
ncbi:hypothetical protein G9A89_021005 [Geosiphon pyriformis]|nr:hypothetical protein G9A89_021005 [Geosiphon pyriformis]